MLRQIHGRERMRHKHRVHRNEHLPSPSVLYRKCRGVRENYGGFRRRPRFEQRWRKSNAPTIVDGTRTLLGLAERYSYQLGQLCLFGKSHLGLETTLAAPASFGQYGSIPKGAGRSTASTVANSKANPQVDIVRPSAKRREALLAPAATTPVPGPVGAGAVPYRHQRRD
jgi:hypothetical protein